MLFILLFQLVPAAVGLLNYDRVQRTLQVPLEGGHIGGAQFLLLGGLLGRQATLAALAGQIVDALNGFIGNHANTSGRV